VSINPKPKSLSLEQALERIAQAAGQAQAPNQAIDLGQILEAVGQRSFGVMLLVAGVIVLAPLIGDIPGVPTLMALLVLVTAAQILLGRRHLWLPRWLVQRSMAGPKVQRAVEWMRKPSRFVDRFLRPRLTAVVQGPGLYAIAAACAAIALLTPAMELVPFSANGAGAALAAFGLALTARDGLLALLAYLFMAVTFGALLLLM
jgi:hypothetical protein